MRHRASYLIICGVLMAGLTGAADRMQAQSTADPPPTIRQREVNQQKRIAEGIENGQLTPRETARIEKQESNLNQEIRHDRKTGGGLSPKERRQINRQQNRLSREIYRQKHDRQTAPPAK